MKLAGLIVASASVVAGHDIISGLTAIFDGFTSDLADGASVITSLVANPGDAFETITSHIDGAFETATSNIDAAIEAATSRIANASDDDEDDEVDITSTTSVSDSTENAAPTALPHRSWIRCCGSRVGCHSVIKALGGPSEPSFRRCYHRKVL